MKYTSLSLAISMISLTAMAETKTYDIELQNQLGTSRTDCPVVVVLSDLELDFPVASAVVMDGQTEIPCQLDDLNGDDIADELALVVDMQPNETKTLTLSLSDDGIQGEYPARVWAGYQLRGPKKEQYVDVTEVTVPGHVDFYNMVYGHGPMLESELVGYRVYFNQKQTLDPYGKFTKRLELADTRFYPTDAHREAGYGDDVLMAGNSCGVGAFKGWDGTKATHIEPVKSRTERIVTTGPVRVIAEAEVDDWDYQGEKLDMVNRYTLYAGHRDIEIESRFRHPLDDKTFATGVECIMGNETQKYADGQGLVASWGRYFPVTDTVKYAKETIGIATYVPKRYVVDQVDDADNFLYVLSAPGEESIKYNTMFTSRKETYGYEDSAAWFGYLPSWREELENPIIVKITAE